jgi:uncharacterized Zn-binding protein involved in type VI secretion
MSFGIAVKGKDSAGGTQLAGGQSSWFVEDSLIVLQGDPVAGHGKSPHASPNMSQGSSWFTIDGVPVCRADHKASCGHASTGRGWFTLPD